MVKKLYIIVLAAICGCTVEKLEGPVPDKNESCPSGYERLYLETPEAKTGLSGTQVSWQSGDNIIVNGNKYTVLFDELGAAYADVKPAASYDAFFPAELWDGSDIYIQPAQFYAAGSFGAKSNPMYASSKTSGLKFNHLMGALKLTVKGSGTVASISVRDKAGASVCGLYSFSGTDITPKGDIQFDDIVLNCKTKSNGGVALTEAGTDFYIVMPARTYSSGLKITISCIDGHSMTIDSSTPRTIQKGSALATPAITFSYPSNQIYEYHLDNLVLGSDPVGNRLGFKTANPSKLTGFEYLTAFTTDRYEDGTSEISVSGTNGDFAALGKPYAYSRNIQSFTKVMNTRECHGYLACGTGLTAKASFKFPALTNIGNGIYKVEYSWKMAFRDGHLPATGIQLLHTTSTPGKVLELWVDGVDKTGSMADGTRWCSTSSNGEPVLSDAINTQERILIRKDDFNNDTQWHTVKLVLGAVTKKTVLEFNPFGSAVDQPWYIDDIKAEKLDYDFDSSNVLPVSMLVGTFSSSYLTAVETFASNYGIRNIDLSVSANVLFSSGNYGIASLNDEDWVTVDQKISDIKKRLDAAGVKVNSIHLPYSNLKEGGVSDANAFEWCTTDETARAAAVNRLKVIIRHLAPFEPKYWMIHTTYHHEWDFDGYTSTGWWLWEEKTYYKDCGVKSFKDLVSYVATVTYSDKTHGSLTIENIANTGDGSGCIAGSVDKLVWFCQQCPGLGICLDSGHAVVNHINTTGSSDGNLASAIAKCGSYLKHLHIHGNNPANNKDCHLMPGYVPGTFVNSSFSTTDGIDWGHFYKALLDNGYDGVFSYEYSSPEYDGDFRDCIASFPNIVHNYYEVILKAYNNL